ncbi:jg15620 [Pararge aegeria aegeria]|uniref:Jg15620 protein n=1 Tax=Pararge aegeria aegeria TaxID=348720 RepID=A0A8S4RUW1_9NEOP|nr:jg15620 [Pararge aegeria aegeria]
MREGTLSQLSQSLSLPTGYGHIAPKTQTGKVVTIFYAILGIPLMLLCLSNIGDVMASSFRFLYWRVCCYVCTRPPKQSRRHIRRMNRAGSTMGSTRRRRPLERSFSDNDFRYRDSGYNSAKPRRGRPAPPGLAPSRTRSQPPAQARSHAPGPREYEEDRSPIRHDKYERDPYEDEDDEFPKVSLPLKDLQMALKDLDNYQPKASKPDVRSKSLPRPSRNKPEFGPKRDFDDSRHFDIEDDREMYEMHDLFDVDYANYRERKALEERDNRRGERDDYRFRDRGYDPEDEDFEFDIPRTRRSGNDRRHDRGRSEYYERDLEESPAERRRGRRAKSAVYENERRYEDIDDERDLERGRRRLRRLHTVEEPPHARPPYRYTPSPERDDWSDEPPPIRRGRSSAWGSRQSDIYAIQGPAKEEIKPVPIWLCVFLVASYIVTGTFLFKRWEGWAYLDAAYFCFITLTTIGFGDFVPAQGQSGEAADAVHSIALCSLYLLFGIALLAMSFNLVQEEVRANVAAVATRLGIIKPRDTADD